MAPEVSNAIGYAAGLAVAFVLNRVFVFEGARLSIAAGVRFAVSFGIAFALNQAVLVALTRGAGMAPELAQVFAMVCYTVIFYFLNKHFVFHAASRIPPR